MMLNNVDTFYRYIRETKTTRAKIADVEQQTQDEQRRTEELNQRLRGINVKVLADQTQFVNARLAERAFSWSELLDRLERVIPDDVHIDSISPSFDRSGMVHLSLSCVAKTGTGMINTIDRLTRDPHFANAFPTTEDHTANGWRFGMGVDYRPSIARTIE
jgi:Tfp pilus assembly protein PilN